MGSVSALTLTFGEGLDRHSGPGPRDPRRFSDIRNLELARGTAMVRRGMDALHTVFLDGGATPMSRVVALFARSNRVSVELAYYSPTRTLQYFHGGVFQGTAFIYGLAPASQSYFLAESYDKVFAAHAGRVMPTMYLPGVGAGVPITADLNGAGATTVGFSGVVSYLNYLVGWGFASASDPTREDIVRISLPGQPTVFKAEHYLMVGARNDPVLNCLPVGGRLLVFKEHSITPILGTNRANFGVGQAVDRFYGLAGPRLACLDAEGSCYFWSKFGPRMTTGGPSVNLALSLDLEGPQPSDLVASGSLFGGFAQYVPGKNLVKFIFGQRGYVLHLNEPLRWTYEEYGVSLACGGLQYDAVPDAIGHSGILAAYGQTAGNKVLTLDRYNAGAHPFTDDGAAITASGKTVPVAPAGAEGECAFRQLTLSVNHTMAVTLTITPYVNGVAQEAKQWILTAKPDRTLETKDFNLAQPYVSGTERGRSHPRGAWFSVKVTTSGGLAAGDLLFEQAILEYEVVRESRPAA